MARQNKDKKKRLRSLVLLLFLTIVLLTTSTYAWFTANRSVTINPIDVHVASSAGLQISTDASEWKTIISNTDITDPGEFAESQYNVNQFPYELAPVSSDGSATAAGRLTFYKGIVEGSAGTGDMALHTAPVTENNTTTYPALTEAKGTTGDFVAFDIWLKVDADSDVFLDSGSGVSVTVADPARPDKGLQYAARYAFVIEGHGNSTDTVASLQALAPTAASEGIVIEPNYDAHKASGATNANRYYGLFYNSEANDTSASATNVVTAASGHPPIPYVGVINGIPKANEIILINTNPNGKLTATDTTSHEPSSSYFDSVATLYRTNVAYTSAATGLSYYEKDTNNSTQTTDDDSNLVKLFHLTEGVTKVRVYMWVEGQDVDCENAASGAYITYSIGLTLDDLEITSP